MAVCLTSVPESGTIRMADMLSTLPHFWVCPEHVAQSDALTDKFHWCDGLWMQWTRVCADTSLKGSTQ